MNGTFSFGFPHEEREDRLELEHWLSSRCALFSPRNLPLFRLESLSKSLRWFIETLLFSRFDSIYIFYSCWMYRWACFTLLVYQDAHLTTMLNINFFGKKYFVSNKFVYLCWWFEVIWSSLCDFPRNQIKPNQTHSWDKQTQLLITLTQPR